MPLLDAPTGLPGRPDAAHPSRKGEHRQNEIQRARPRGVGPGERAPRSRTTAHRCAPQIAVGPSGSKVDSPRPSNSQTTLRGRFR
jgi:hypothetical protein